MDNTEREDSDGSPELSPRQRALEQLPRLPKPRPRDLTPLGFRDASPIPQDSPKPLFQHCAYYKIPPEIRRYILRLAFGDSRVHMDLSYGCPDLPLRCTRSSTRFHCGIINKESEDGRQRIIDESKPKSWHWWGSVCHRLPPDLDITRVGPMTHGGPDGPWADYCRIGQANCCHSWPGSMPYKCQIGIMGWLLSCRQNYAEAIDVLYATNTIIMSGETMISSLPQLLLSHRLSDITSLEISWNLKTRHVGQTWEAIDVPDLEMLLQALSTNFPKLRRLYLSLQGSRQLGAYHEPDLWPAISPYLDDFARNTSSLSEFSVSFPDVIFDALYGEAAWVKVDDHGEASINSYYQVWRSLGGKIDVIRLPYVDSYPRPPHHLTSLDPNRQGYWILSGSNMPKEPRFEPTPSGPTHREIFDMSNYPELYIVDMPPEVDGISDPGADFVWVWDHENDVLMLA